MNIITPIEQDGVNGYQHFPVGNIIKANKYDQTFMVIKNLNETKGLLCLDNGFMRGNEWADSTKFSLVVPGVCIHVKN